MNSNRLQYVPLERGQSPSWLTAVVAAACCLGVVGGLVLSSSPADSNMYTAAAVRTASVTPVQYLRHVGPNPALMAATMEEASTALGSEAPSAGPSTLRWSSLAAVPLAALAGFAMGYWRPITQQAVQDQMEIIINAQGEDIAMAATTGPRTSLYAVVAIGGHQYIVQPGQILSIDKLPLEVGDQFTFDKVLLLKNGDKVEFGTPYLTNARVTAEVLRNSKGRKIRVFKYRSKKHTRITRGHRQKYTDVFITEVAGTKVPSRVAALEAAKAEAAALNA